MSKEEEEKKISLEKKIDGIGNWRIAVMCLHSRFTEMVQDSLTRLEIVQMHRAVGACPLPCRPLVDALASPYLLGI
jgi:hypothetical protein